MNMMKPCQTCLEDEAPHEQYVKIGNLAHKEMALDENWVFTCYNRSIFCHCLEVHIATSDSFNFLGRILGSGLSANP